MNYFKSAIEPQPGDIIATGWYGMCRILEITLDKMLHVQNLITGERFHVYPDDCDLITRKDA